MKRIILILLLFSNYLSAQQWQPTSIRQRFVNGIGIPTRDTLPGALSDSSQLVLRPQDSVIYFKYKGYWRALGGQPQLNGTGFVKASGTTISYDNSSYYLASNPNGYTSNVGTVTSVGGTGTVSGLTLSGTVTSSGNLTLGGALSLTSGQVTTALGFTPYNATNPAGYITSASLSGYLPLTGGTLASSGSTNTLNINHSSGSGIALNISKNGNGEGLTIVKGSGSGNAASITGGITLLSELNLTTKLADAHINSAAVWNAKQNALNGTGFVKASGTTISYDNTSYQPLLTNPTTGTGTTNYVTKWTGTSTLGNSTIFDNGTNVGIGTASPSGNLHVKAPSGSAIFRVEDGGGNSIGRLQANAGDGSLNLFQQSNYDLTFGTNNTERLRILANGNVGIGSTSPTTKLHVLANSAADEGNAAAIIRQGGGNNNNGLLVDVTNSVNAYIADFRQANSSLMRLTGAGNLGIGTTTPAEKLSVAGRLLVNTNTTDGANALQVNGSAKVSSLAGTGERLVAADASGKLVVSATAATVMSGTYTPTATSAVNATSITIYSSPYTQIGNVVTVTVSGQFTPTAGNTYSKFNLNLPVQAISQGSAVLYGVGNISRSDVTLLNTSAKIIQTTGTNMGFNIESFPNTISNIIYFSANIQYTLQ
jgi:hypothetical protein